MIIGNLMQYLQYIWCGEHALHQDSSPHQDTATQ